MDKSRGRPIHGVVCKEEEIMSVIYYRVENVPYQKSKQVKFTEDEIEELCRP